MRPESPGYGSVSRIPVYTIIQGDVWLSPVSQGEGNAFVSGFDSAFILLGDFSSVTKRRQFGYFPLITVDSLGNYKFLGNICIINGETELQSYVQWQMF